MHSNLLIIQYIYSSLAGDMHIPIMRCYQAALCPERARNYTQDDGDWKRDKASN